MKLLKILFLLLLTFGVISSCSKSETKRKRISVTIVPQKYFAEKIAGDKYEINLMVPAGSSPESYDPSPSTLIDLGKSEAYFMIGKIGFEIAWADKLKSNYPDLKFFDNSKNIEFIETNEHECSHEDDHHHEGVDPHIWMSPNNALVISKNMLDAFIDLDPSNKDYYISNYNALAAEIESMKLKIDSIMGTVSNKSFVIYHPSLTYFAKDYNLNQLSIENDGKEPSAMSLKNIINEIKDEGTSVVFIQEEFDKKNAEVIANEIGGKVVTINPLSYNWSGEMIKTANALSQN